MASDYDEFMLRLWATQQVARVAAITVWFFLACVVGAGLACGWTAVRGLASLVGAP